LLDEPLASSGKTVRESPEASCGPSKPGHRARSSQYELAFDLNRRINRQRRDANSRTRVPALVAKDFDHQVGGAVHHLWAVEKCRRRIDETAEPHDARDLVEVAERDLDLRQEIDRTGARGPLAVLDRDDLAELAFGRRLAVRAETDLAGNEQQRAGAHEADVIGDRSRRCRERNTESLEFLFHHLGHVLLLTAISSLNVRANLAASVPVFADWMFTCKASVPVQAQLQQGAHLPMFGCRSGAAGGFDS